ncbi:hypothetical protein [Cohnella luojiensis]|uniref:Right handed beta helix domain-containing protein n=1 Tax=Cohnella luojiensis TaxID=652876 RepID=A0A4Y8LW30_9BACL|nr:hypothetical protein [Cohnella luojiensis]TFE23454.1 hypothetical protein E2980_19055 [Cohnella luojiensis]
MYNETVIINKSIQLLGAQAGVDARTRSGIASTESIVTGPSIALIQAVADRVVIDGFTVQNNTTGPGIFTSAAFSGYWVMNNIIQNNVFGILNNSSGARYTEVRQNFLRSNNQPGAGSGNGILSDMTTSNIWVDSNLFTGHQLASVNFSPAGTATTDIIISNNRMVTDNSITLANTNNVKIFENNMTDTQGSSIFFGGSTNQTDIERNILHNSISNGINVTTFFTGVPNANIRAKYNSIQGNSNAGLQIVAGSYNVTPPNDRLDATNNWWGSPTGPAPIGSGDRVIDPGNVAEITPFLTSDPFITQQISQVLSTGPILGPPGTQTVRIEILNDDPISTAVIEIIGFYLPPNSAKLPYVHELFTINPNIKVLKSFFVNSLDQYEYQFGILNTSNVLISVWAIDVNGNVLASQRVVASEQSTISTITPNVP